MVPAKGYHFHPAAELELEEAAEWYEEERAGLGGEFLASVRASITRIVQAPEVWPVSQGSRRALLRRFPYALVYRVQDDRIVEILALAHFKRRPKYWADR